jgi:hypothetical protein
MCGALSHARIKTFSHDFHLRNLTTIRETLLDILFQNEKESWRRKSSAFIKKEKRKEENINRRTKLIPPNLFPIQLAENVQLSHNSNIISYHLSYTIIDIHTWTKVILWEAKV